MKLDPTGYHILSKPERAEVDAWLVANGFAPSDTVSYEVVGEGSVRVVTLARDADGKARVDPEDRYTFAKDVALIATDSPPPHFNRYAT